MAEKTVEEHAAYIYKMVGHSLAYGITRNYGIKRVREYLEQHFQLKEGEQS